MSKELIRNGGFERGDTEFWEFEDVASIEALAVAKKYGSYGCKIISDGHPVGYLHCKDFIAVKYGIIYNVNFWIKNSLNKTVHLYVREYDSDKEYIGAVSILSTSVSTTFKFLSDFYIGRSGVSYFTISVRQVNFSINDYSYVDSISLSKIDLYNVGVIIEELISIENETIKHTVYGTEFFCGIWKEAEYFFDLTSFTETGGASAVTIDVKIQTYDPKTAKWRDAMVFQQKSCPASGSVTTQEYKRLASNLGWKQRVVYTTAGAGTIGDCDFKVGVVYKR